MNILTRDHKGTAIAAGTKYGGSSSLKRAIAAAVVAISASAFGAVPSLAQDTNAEAPADAAGTKAPVRLEAGSLTCKGEGGWGAILFSKKTFDCTFVTADGSTRGSYKGTITKVGLDVGVTGDTALLWLVFAPSDQVADNYRAGSLAGEYVGVGVEATLGAGVGANALLGGNESQFVLQPVSVQVQTGVSIAAAVQTLKLEYLGELN